MDAVGPAHDFDATLHARTPRPWVTWWVLLLNVGLFLLMVAYGDNGVWAEARGLVAWGGNFGPRTLQSGEWWRLLTAAFLHGGIIHLALNCVMLLDGGPVLERAVGHWQYAAIYLLTAIVASLAGAFVHPEGVSVGASGAVFGVFGALLGLALRHAPPEHRWRHVVESLRAHGHQAIPPDGDSTATGSHTLGEEIMPASVARRLLGGILVLFLFNLAAGLLTPGIDNSAHVGGFVFGILLGWTSAGSLAAQLGRGEASGGRDRLALRTAAGISVVLLLSALFPFAPPALRFTTYDLGCRANIAAGCLAAATHLQSSRQASARAGAVRYLSQACARDSAVACSRLGASQLAAGDAARGAAIDAFARACELGDQRSCASAGVALDTAPPKWRDFPRAIRYYDKACDAGEARGCFALAEVYRLGRGMPPDPAKARALHVHFCMQGERQACAAACTMGVPEACARAQDKARPGPPSPVPPPHTVGR